MGMLSVIGAGVGGYFGGPAGAALGANIGGGMDTNAANAERADVNNAWSAQQYATRYQTQVADLKAAGLNPMLAYSQSPGSAPTAQQVQFQNPFANASSDYQKVASAQQAEAHVEQMKHQNEQIDATVEQIKETIKKIPLERDQIKYTIQKLAEEAANIAQDTENKVQARKQIISMVNKTNAETSLLKNQLAVEQALDNLGRTTKEVAPGVKILLDLFRSVK